MNNEIKYPYTLIFSKQGKLIFISHLDLIRLFERVLKRSDLPLVYTQGFNPHIKFAVLFPLGLGQAGLREPVEIFLRKKF